MQTEMDDCLLWMQEKSLSSQEKSMLLNCKVAFPCINYNATHNSIL